MVGALGWQPPHQSPIWAQLALVGRKHILLLAGQPDELHQRLGVLFRDLGCLAQEQLGS